MPTSTKPIVRGPIDGNIFTILGASTKALKRAGLNDEATELQTKVLNADSYSAALKICMEYVKFDLDD